MQGKLIGNDDASDASTMTSSLRPSWQFSLYIYQPNLIACMWCLKRVILYGSCPGGQGCGAKKEMRERT